MAPRDRAADPNRCEASLTQSLPKKSANKKSGRAKKARRGPESPYFLRPVSGGIGVYRRPVGNRAEPTTCGIMPNKKTADALVAQLKRAESVVSDLFLEATDDGIEALEAVLAACREAVLKQGAPQGGRRGARPAPAATDAAAEGQPANGGRRRGRGRRRRRGGAGGEQGPESAGGSDEAPYAE